VAPDRRLLHEKYGLLSGRTIAIEGGQHWRKTVETVDVTMDGTDTMRGFKFLN